MSIGLVCYSGRCGVAHDPRDAKSSRNVAVFGTRRLVSSLAVGIMLDSPTRAAVVAVKPTGEGVRDSLEQTGVAMTVIRLLRLLFHRRFTLVIIDCVHHRSRMPV